MAVRKSELYASLWASCDELRGGMAACVQLSILRVAERVAHGGHDVPLAVLQRRLPRSIRLFLETYAPAVNHALCNMNAGAKPVPIFSQTGINRTIIDPLLYAQLLNPVR